MSGFVNRGLKILVVLAAAGPVSALGAAQDLSIAAFFGIWKGNALSESELSTYFRLTERDLDVIIRPTHRGFAITWTTVLRQKGDPANPEIRRKSTSLSFVRTERSNVWRAATSGDPLAGYRLAWARVKGPTLTVTSLVIEDDGGFEMQIYRRTLSGLGMALEFVRLDDGETVRTAKGRLIKYAE